METVQFTVPSGAPGTADITLTTANGSITAAGAFLYAPAANSYPLPGSSLQSGIYDPHRSVYYFADTSKIQVLSLTAGGWQAPFTLPGVGNSTQLSALSLSPDGSKLAVSDYGDRVIYVLNPDSPASVTSYAVQQPAIVGANSAPTGLCITNGGVIYYAAAYLGGSGGPDFEELDTNTGITTVLQTGTAASTDTRVLLSVDGTHVYWDADGFTFDLDIGTGQIGFSTATGLAGDVTELSMSADGTTLAANGYILDTSLNPSGIIEYTDRETWLPTAVVGQKLNKNGSVFLQPLTDGIDVIDVNTGRLVNRVQLSLQLPTVYDSLVVDGTDDVVVAITTTGVATIDLTSAAATPATQIRVNGAPALARPTARNAPHAAPGVRHALISDRPQLKRLKIRAP